MIWAHGKNRASVDVTVSLLRLPIGSLGGHRPDEKNLRSPVWWSQVLASKSTETSQVKSVAWRLRPLWDMNPLFSLQSNLIPVQVGPAPKPSPSGTRVVSGHEASSERWLCSTSSVFPGELALDECQLKTGLHGNRLGPAPPPTTHLPQDSLPRVACFTPVLLHSMAWHSCPTGPGDT